MATIREINLKGGQSIAPLRIPRVRIIEQPAPNKVRFRYACEGRCAGSIPGVSSTKDNKRFPTVQILDYHGPARVEVCCVTADPPFV